MKFRMGRARLKLHQQLVGAGFAEPVLPGEAPDLVAFTVIVRGVRRFAVPVAILVLTSKMFLVLSEPRNPSCFFDGVCDSFLQIANALLQLAFHH